jgi:nucleoid-associated protein YgaU
MSALQAEQLPEVPAASPKDSAQNRAAVRWTAPLEPAPTEPCPPADPQPVRTQPAPSQPARSQPARSQAARNQAASVPLRLTRRGRVVVAVAAALVLAALSLVIAGSAQATNHPVPSGAAQRTVAQVIVRPGQSLWSVAENADPGADTRVVIQQIVELNGLTADTVFAGQHLRVPRG